MHREPNFQCGSMLRRNQVMRMPESAWKKITCHLERNRLLAEKTENEREYRKALQEESRRLRSHWDNSLQVTIVQYVWLDARCNFICRIPVILKKNLTRKKKRIKLNCTYEFAKNRRKQERSIWRRRRGPCTMTRHFQSN